MDRYKHFFYNNLDLACFANLEGYFEEINDTFTKILGYASSDLLEKKFYEFIHPDDVKATMEIMRKLSHGIDSFSFINRYRAKSGSYIYIEWNSRLHYETKKINSIGRDVTEKILANKELVFQNEEKGKRAAELIVANIELAFQNKEKGKRATELIIANKELVFQNKEKGKRATELIIANKELVFENEEKEKRAAELIIANIELAFQNDEKGKRAAELIIANKELVFQNKEKGKRAVELNIACKELKRTEEYLEEYIKGMEKMIFMISNNAQRPLAHILNLADLMQRSINSPDKLQQLVSSMQETIHSFDTSTGELTTFMNKLEQNRRKKNAA